MATDPINEILSKLHLGTARLLLEKVESGEATAAEVSNALKMLKDNGIEALPTPESPLGELAGKLPDFMEQDEAYN